VNGPAAAADPSEVRIRLLVFIVLALGLLAPQGAEAATIIVKRVPGLSAAERADLRAAAGVRFVEPLPLPRTELVSAPEGQVGAALRALNRDGDVEYAELDRPIRALSADPEFDEQWGLENPGNRSFGSILGVFDADMDVPEAWTMSTGDGATVAVVDSGVATHPDLAGRLLLGYDWVAGDGDADDENGHGTHVAGTIAAAKDNDVGIAGVAPDAKLLPLRVLAANGIGDPSDAISAFAYAASEGVRVINASLGGQGALQAERDAIAAHPEILFVFAAGNDGLNNDGDPNLATYPCSYDLPNILCVGASRPDDRRAGFSNYGAASVDLFAPGYAIRSTIPGGGYANRNGTSMAAPHVAGTAALLLARNPTLSPADVKAALIGAAEQKAAFANRAVSGGRANARAALLTVDGDRDDDDVADAPDNRPAPAPAPVPKPPANPRPPAPDRDGDGHRDAADGCPSERALTADGCPLPALASLSVKARRRTATVRVRADRAATVQVTVERRRCKRRRCRWARVARRTVASRTGSAKVVVRRLRRGRYRVVVVLSSGAGTADAVRKRFKA
jgi:subtilisin family serine protease